MEPGLAVQFITGLPREMLFSFYFTGGQPQKGAAIEAIAFPARPPRLSGARPACLALRSIAGRWRAGLC